MRVFNIVVLALGIVLVVLPGGCKGKTDEPVVLELPNTPAIPRPASHGVAIEPYVRVHQDQSVESVVVAVLRKGEIFEVSDVHLQPMVEKWISAQTDDATGWILAEQVRLFSSRAQAVNAGALTGTSE